MVDAEDVRKAVYLARKPNSTRLRLPLVAYAKYCTFKMVAMWDKCHVPPKVHPIISATSENPDGDGDGHGKPPSSYAPVFSASFPPSPPVTQFAR